MIRLDLEGKSTYLAIIEEDLGVRIFDDFLPTKSDTDTIVSFFLLYIYI